MSTINCSSCDELRENCATFVTSGVTDTVCTSLQNNTGFNPNLAVLHDDATDLHNANDCLVGMMDAQIEAYDTCDWKEYMHNFVRNIYEVLKAIICSIKGLWTKVDSIESLCDTTSSVLDIALNVAPEVAGTIVTEHLENNSGTATLSVKARTVTADICGTTATVDLFTGWISGGWRANGITEGEVLATWTKSQLVPDKMHESTWNQILQNHYYIPLMVVGDEYVVYGDFGETAGYDDLLACRATSIVTGTSASGTLHTIQNTLTAFRIA